VALEKAQQKVNTRNTFRIGSSFADRA